MSSCTLWPWRSSGSSWLRLPLRSILGCGPRTACTEQAAFSPIDNTKHDAWYTQLILVTCFSRQQRKYHSYIMYALTLHGLCHVGSRVSWFKVATVLQVELYTLSAAATHLGALLPVHWRSTQSDPCRVRHVPWMDGSKVRTCHCAAALTTAPTCAECRTTSGCTTVLRDMRAD